MEIKTREELLSYNDETDMIKKWVAVVDIIRELRNSDVNDEETIEEAYDFLAEKTNKIIEALTQNSK